MRKIIILAFLLSGCGPHVPLIILEPTLVIPTPNITPINMIPPTPSPTPVIIYSPVPGPSGAVGEPGPQGSPGPMGSPGPAPTGVPVVTTVQFCTNVSASYPTIFPEYGLCIQNQVYAVYSANGGFLALIPPGAYRSNAIGSACDFTVLPNCQISN